MVVPDRNERVLAVCLLQIGIRAICRISDSVVAQRDRLAPWFRNPKQSAAVTVSAVLELVDVVADVDDRIEIGAVRHAAIDVEKPGRVVRAAQ